MKRLKSLFKDRLSSYRFNNIIKTLEKAQGKLIYDTEKEKLTINPRIAYQILENASLTESDELQEMWAGLFAASCNVDTDDENIIFIDVLKQLTSSQVKLLNFICSSAVKSINLRKYPEIKRRGFLRGSQVILSLDKIYNIMSTENFPKISTEVSSLITLGLLSTPLNQNAHMISPFENMNEIRVLPTFLLLQLFVKCQGHNTNPFEYFHIEIQLEAYDKLKHKIEFLKKEGIMEFLYSQYQKHEPYQISLATDHINLAKELAEMDLKQLNSILNAFALSHYRNFDFEKNYKIKYGKRILGSYNYYSGFLQDRTYRMTSN